MKLGIQYQFQHDIPFRGRHPVWVCATKMAIERAEMCLPAGHVGDTYAEDRGTPAIRVRFPYMA